MAKKNKTGKDGIDTQTGVQIARAGTMLIPGAYGHVADIGLSAVDGSLGAAKEEKALEEELGIDHVRRHAGKSRALQEELDQFDNRAAHKMGGAAVATGGAIAGAAAVGGAAATAGAAIGTAICPIAGTAAGWIIGGAASLAGGSLAHCLYEKATEKADPDALIIVRKIARAQDAGATDIPPEAVFAALAANLPENRGKAIEDRLEKLTGTRDFHKALDMGKNAELRTMMEEFDTEISAATGVLNSDPTLTTSEWFAQKLNSGAIHPRALLLNNDNLDVLMAQANLPPEVQNIAGDLRKSGVVPTPPGEGKPKLPPLSSQDLSRN